jgi:hypothetical protein
MKAATKATRVKTADAAPAALDVMLGPSDGLAGFKRVDVAISRQSDGHLRIQLDVPAPSLGQRRQSPGCAGRQGRPMMHRRLTGYGIPDERSEVGAS